MLNRAQKKLFYPIVKVKCKELPKKLLHQVIFWSQLRELPSSRMLCQNAVEGNLTLFWSIMTGFEFVTWANLPLTLYAIGYWAFPFIIKIIIFKHLNCYAVVVFFWSREVSCLLNHCIKHSKLWACMNNLSVNSRSEL